MITVLLDGEPLRLADGPLPQLIKRGHHVYALAETDGRSRVPQYQRAAVLDIGDRV